VLAFVALLATPAAIADPPVLSGVPGNQTLEATGPGGAAFSWPDPTAIDEGLIPVPVSCAPPSGTTFPITTTTVTCSATDPITSETSSQSFDVTVQDTTPPVVTVPGGITAEATGPGGAAVSFSASASDTVDGSLPVNCSPSSGSAFPLGTTSVTCSATDTRSNTGSASFSVTVQDTTAPSITVPGNITAGATGPSGAVVTFSASGSDLVDTSVTVSCSPPSGSVFPVGTTSVTCTATDDSGNSAQGSFSVTVQDTTPPNVSVPANITAEATGPAGADVGFTVTATDNVDATPTISCAPPSGSTFPITTTTVSCTATDDAGNTSSAKTFTVTVRDTTPPAVTVPGDIVVEATGPSGAAVSFSASATDIVNGAVTPTCTPGSGSTFPIATTTVTCTATDSRANSASATFRVTVRDGKGPVFSQVPVGPVVEADGPGGSRVTYAPPVAVDAVNGPVLVACTPGPGSLFPLGTSTVTCVAKDNRGNSDSVSFPVRVVDTTKPALNVPSPQDVSSKGAQSLSRDDPQVVTFLRLAVARDLVDGNVAVTNDAPPELPLGRTRITFTARDTRGNTATGQSELNVVEGAVAPTRQDTTPPKDVTKLRAKPGDATVLLTWVPPKADFDHVRVSRSPGRNGAPATVLYTGRAKELKDTKLKNGTEFRYVVVAYDKAGNFSPGVVARATPVRPLLYAPVEGATVASPPLLRWVGVTGATYYNVQVFRARSARSTQAGRKIFSAWPARPQMPLARSWKFNGKREQLTPGTYIWFAWPGFGAKAANRYGPLIGQSRFVVKRKK
jgi:HYR domain-containing protein